MKISPWFENNIFLNGISIFKIIFNKISLCSRAFQVLKKENLKVEYLSQMDPKIK